MTVEVPGVADENNVVSGLADAAPGVSAVRAAREAVVSPPNSSDPASAVRAPRRMPVFIGLPRPSVAPALPPEWSRPFHVTRQAVLPAGEHGVISVQTGGTFVSGALVLRLMRGDVPTPPPGGRRGRSRWTLRRRLARVVNPRGMKLPGPGSGSIVLVRFKSRRAAERMVASLVLTFERTHTRARQRRSSSPTITTVHSNSSSPPVLTSRGLAVSVTKLTAGILTGLGLLQAISVFGGTKTATHAGRQHQSHVGQEDKRLAELLDQLGPKAACVVFHWMDHAAGQVVATEAASVSGTTCSSPTPSSWPCSTAWAANTTGCVLSSRTHPEGEEAHKGPRLMANTSRALG